jgi:DUF1009 family protein
MQKTDGILLIAGRREYPRLVIEAARAAGVQRIEVVAFKHETDAGGLKRADRVHWIRFGSMTDLLACIQTSGISNVMMVGQIAPRHLFSMRFDEAAKTMLATLPIRNAHTIFSAVIDKIESVGATVIPAHSFMDQHMPSPGVISSRAPTLDEESDAGLGIRYLRQQSVFDVGQTIVIKAGYIVAVEAMEGTDQTIRRAGRIGGKGSVVVKMPRIEHDFRFDIPVIGPSTVQVMKRAGATCLAIESRSTLIFDRKKTVALAKAADIAIYATESLR